MIINILVISFKYKSSSVALYLVLLTEKTVRPEGEQLSKSRAPPDRLNVRLLATAIHERKRERENATELSLKNPPDLSANERAGRGRDRPNDVAKEFSRSY